MSNIEIGALVVLCPLLLAFAVLTLIDVLDRRSTTRKRADEPAAGNLLHIDFSKMRRRR